MVLFFLPHCGGGTKPATHESMNSVRSFDLFKRGSFVVKASNGRLDC